MKQRTPRASTNRMSLMTSASMPRVRSHQKREEMDRPGDEPGVTIVPGPQFDALLALLDNPPEIPEELRREVANRRWK